MPRRLPASQEREHRTTKRYAVEHEPPLRKGMADSGGHCNSSSASCSVGLAKPSACGIGRQPRRPLVVQSGRVPGLREDDRLGRQAGASARERLGFETSVRKGRESVHRQRDFRPCELGRELDLGRRQRDPRRCDQVREVLGSRSPPDPRSRADLPQARLKRRRRAEAAASFASSSCGAGRGVGRRLCSAPTRSEGATAAAWSCRRRP
jgi:hypothetical protein